MEFHTFGYWLKLKRKSLDLTREALAERVGCSAATIRKLEAEERRPSGQIAERLADIFQIPAGERQNFLRFARGDLRSAPGMPQTTAPWDAPAAPRTNLPAAVTSLVGRTVEIAEIRAQLTKAETRIQTLIGPPGIGKTRLSLEAARSVLSNFPDGVFFIALAPLDNPALIAAAIAQTLGYVDKKNRAAFETLEDGIGDKRMLLVLDNCEHLIDDIAPLASGLLSACPRLKILATSRESLRIPGEWLYHVPVLGIPQNTQIDLATADQFPALTLFAERARAVRSDFALNQENVQAVASICSQLDGLPLAIELLASRMRLMTPQTLLEHMTGQFVLSADGMRAVSARQKTLNNAIGWSYDFLLPEEQEVLARLSVFLGSFSQAAAEAVAVRSADKPVFELVNALADKSLLQRSFSADGETRFSMLVTIRQFALEQLQRSGEEAQGRDRHLAHFLAFAELANQEMHGSKQVEWIECLDNEYDNFRGALEWCISQKETEVGLRLISALSWYWGLWRHNSEIRGWFEKVQSLPDLAVHPALYAQLLNHIGYSNWLSGNFLQARAILKESLSLWETLRKAGQAGKAEALCYLGMVAHSIDADYETARSLFKQSIELYRAGGHSWGVALALFNLGWVDDHENQDESAQNCLEKSLDIFTQLGDWWGMGRSSQFLGQLFLKLEKYEKAEKYFKQHLEIDERLQFKPGCVIALGNLGDLYRHQGSFDRAEQHFLRSLAVSHEYGIKLDRGYNHFALGVLGLQRGDYEFAKRHMIEYYYSGRSVSQLLAACDLCFGLAAVAGGTDRPDHSALLYGASQAMLQEIDIPYTPFDRAVYERHIQYARSQLGDAQFETIATQGRAMSTEQAVAAALEE